MGAISGTTNQQADAVIEQYKSYYSKMNISQYGTGVLLQTLGESGDAEEAFGANYSSQSNGLEELFASQASKVSINKDNIKKKMWADLEKEVQAFFQENKELRGQYVVAVNNATENGQPEFKITSKESIMEHLDDEFKQESSEVMTTNPVQLFQPSNIDIAKLDAKASPVLEAIVSDFLQKNRGVFQYLANS